MTRLRVDIGEWIEAKAAHPVEHRRRQAIDVLIRAIAEAGDIRDTLFLKGGTLMNLAYGSSRVTTDIDFTTTAPPEGFDRQIETILDRHMTLAALDLGYTHLLFRVQSSEMRPPQPEFPWPTLRMSIGYAEKGGSQERRLVERGAANVLHVDISFNEPVYDWQEVEIADGGDPAWPDEGNPTILAYSVHELVAEKMRAIVQQKVRDRYRRQDIYDIARVVSQRRFTPGELAKIHAIFLTKARSRNFEPTSDMMDDSELRERSRRRYDEMRFDRTGAALDFEADFAAVASLYRSLPWSP
ncbi:nucleotidyl transferase AbiEii/AbiGii toxin family protein [Azospirillum sp. ST 5-10]|uniref:nucleotidyl transferase AbiEii/AbiGii toxin family protein n=1 Tax=unclassified Azospirillum TaxID=2630922 RepID=UPI003F4A81AB